MMDHPTTKKFWYHLAHWTWSRP